MLRKAISDVSVSRAIGFKVADAERINGVHISPLGRKSNDQPLDLRRSTLRLWWGGKYANKGRYGLESCAPG